MEGGIVHDDALARGYGGQEAVFQQGLDDFGDTGATIDKWGDELILIERRHDAEAISPCAGTQGLAAFAFRGIATGADFGVIDPAFIHPVNIAGINRGQFRQERLPLFRIPFPVAKGLFLYVQPIRRSVRQMHIRLTPQSLPIASWVLSGVAAT